ncbi:MAG TPA: hypothetical protein VNT58_07490 [Gaiellaceae bacterium]|nr:hypothetical protein [Gaiellaceae bacterium]
MRLALLSLVVVLTAAAAASAARIDGSARGDRLAGTARADVIVGRGGADRISAGRGNDRVAVQYDGSRDRVACGAGRDVVNADGADRVAADCEVVSRRLSRDVYSAPDAQHESQVEPDSFTWGRTTVAVFQTGRRQNGAANNLAWATSTDDGRTWRGGELPGLTRNAPRPGPSDAASDPVVAYSAVHGTWLFSALAVGTTTRLTVSRSSDGLRWDDPIDAISSPPVNGGIAFDKQWLVCDNGTSSRFRGRCYLVFNDFTRRGMSLVTSTDGGLTWSQPVTLPFTPFYLGAFPVIQPDGTLVILARVGLEERYLGAVRSRDGGATLEQPVQIAPMRAAPTGHRTPDIPAADVDASGRIWVAWHGCILRPTCTGNDVLVAHSADGASWSQPIRATNGRNAAIPAIAAGPGGRIGVLYYASGAQGIDAEYAETTNAGLRWSAPQRLNVLSMPTSWLPQTSAGPMLADYVSLTYTRDGRRLAVWALASPPAGGRLQQAIFATRF